MPSCRVVGYRSDVLCDLIAAYSGEAVGQFRSSVHATYFKAYFEELKAKTILVEDEYIDRDYLEDYAAYYARCFHPYLRTCRRLHFLDGDFSEGDLQEILRGDVARREQERRPPSGWSTLAYDANLLELPCRCAM